MRVVHISPWQRIRLLYGKSVLLRLLLYCFCALAVVSVLMFFVERGVKENQDGGEYQSYGDTLTNIFILFTSGFDVAPPRTLFGKFSAFFILGLGICFLGMFTAEIAAYLVERRMKGSSGMKSVKAENHIVITRWSKDTEAIIDQLMSDDLKERRQIVVIDRDAEQIPIDNPFVEFVRGDPTENDVLERAGILRARCAIIMADPTSEDYNAEDSRNILVTLAIESMNRDVYTCVQILNPANKKHVERANADEIICTNDIATKVVVQSALNHGMSNLLSELLSQGEGSEIYRVRLAPRFTGRTYVDFQCDITRQHRFTLLALVRDDKIISNPEEEVTLQAGDEAFVMAPDHPAVLES